MKGECSMKKEMTVKLPKNPETLIYKEEVFNYIIMLEDEGRLSELPKNLFVYHVISLFADEVNNGGVEQYLENSSGKTYCFLRDCAEYISHEIMTPFLLELCDYINDGNENFEDFDNRFYEIEKKYGFRKAALKYYKENFEIDKIKIPVLKEKESEVCAYFTLTENETCNDIEEGLVAFLEVLAGFSDMHWKIFIYTYLNGEYTVYARTFDGNIDLCALMKDWARNAKHEEARLKICSCFKDVTIESLSDGKKFGISICKSGFEKDEYKMKHKFISAGYDTVNTEGFSRITLKRFYDKSPGLYEKIKSYLEKNYKDYRNIDGVAEGGFAP
jgi:hypothetical protein